MKIKLIIFSALLMFFGACKKESSTATTNKVKVGGVYLSYTDLVNSSANCAVNVSDTIKQFNKIAGIYYSNEPTNHQNDFMVSFADSLDVFNTMWLEIFTKRMNPADFFHKGSFQIDSIMLSCTLGGASFRENFFNINGRLTWDTACFNNRSFKGKGYFEILNTLHSTMIANRFYPSQKINFEFK